MTVATETNAPVATTGPRILGGVPFRTHLTLWRGALSTEPMARWVPTVVVLILWSMSASDGMATLPRLAVDAFLIIAGLTMASAFTMTQDQLRVFGLGRSGRQAHRLLGGAIGVTTFLLIMLLMWGIWRLAGWATPDLLVVAVAVVVLSTVSGVVSLRKMDREVDEGAEEAGESSSRESSTAGVIRMAMDPFSRMETNAARTNGHRRVLDTYAIIGNRALIVACAVMMLPVQALLRGFAHVEATTTMIWVPLALVVVAMFVRMVQSGLSLNQWLVFGGSREDWIRAVMRRGWEIPVGFGLVFLSAAVLEWSLYDGLGWLTASGAFPILHWTGPAEWLVATGAFAAVGALLQAMTWLGVAVTVMYPRRQGIGVAVTTVLGVIVMLAPLMVMGEAADDTPGAAGATWSVSDTLPTLLLMIIAGVVLSGVAAAALKGAARRASVQDHAAVTSYSDYRSRRGRKSTAGWTRWARWARCTRRTRCVRRAESPNPAVSIVTCGFVVSVWGV